MRIHEARRNPELNPRQSEFEQLLQHAGDESVYVSFTSGFNLSNGMRPVKSGPRPKIGINPRSSFNTPLGIYCYPIDYIIQYSRGQGRVNGPYTGSAPWKFLYVIRANADINVIETNTQAIPAYERLKDFIKEIIDDEDRAERLIKYAQDDAKFRDNRTYLWNTARMLAGNTAFEQKFNISKSPVGWNMIMRRIGCDLFVDRNDQGLIHPSEPTQAVFFSTDKFSVVDVIPRKQRGPVSNSTKGVGNEAVRQLIVKQIQNNTFDVSNFDPFWLRYSEFKTLDVLRFLGENAKALQKKAIEQEINRWMKSGDFYGVSDTSEYLEVIGKFVKLDLNVYGHLNMMIMLSNFADIPRILGRDLSRSEWRSFIKRIDDLSAWSKVRELVVNNEREFGIEFVKQWINGDFTEAYHDQITTIDGLIKAFKINLSNRELVNLFIKAPSYAMEHYSEVSEYLTVADWVKAARSAGLLAIAEEAPIEALKIVIGSIGQSEGISKRASVSGLRISVNRLIEAGEDKLVQWFITSFRDQQLFSDRDIVTYIWDNFNDLIIRAISSQNTNFAEFFTFNEPPEGFKLDKRGRALIWMLLERQSRSFSLIDLFFSGLVSLDDIKKRDKSVDFSAMISHMFKVILESESLYDKFAEIDLDYLLDWVDRRGVPSRVQPEHLVRYFKRPIPDRSMYDTQAERIKGWSPHYANLGDHFSSNELVAHLMENVPGFIQNKYAISLASGAQLYQAVIDGYLVLSEMPEETAGHIYAKIIDHDIQLFPKTITDPRFQPIPRSFWLTLGYNTYKEFQTIPLPAEVAIQAISSAALSTITLLDSDKTKFTNHILSKDDPLISSMIESQNKVIADKIATGRVRITNLDDTNLTKIQKNVFEQRFDGVYYAAANTLERVSSTPQEDVTSGLIKYLEGGVRSTFMKIKQPTAAMTTYVEGLISALNQKDIAALKAIDQHGIASLLQQLK